MAVFYFPLIHQRNTIDKCTYFFTDAAPNVSAEKSEDFKNEIEEEPIKEDEEADEEKDEEDDDKFNEKREADSEMQINGASEGQKKKLTNQFNFSDRAALTSVYPVRVSVCFC